MTAIAAIAAGPTIAMNLVPVGAVPEAEMTLPRSVPHRLPGAILVALAVASQLLLVACSPNGEVQSQSPRGPSASSRPDPSAVALEQLQGPWRPKGLPLGAPAVEAVRAACVAAASPVQSFGLADQPVVIADARGLGLVSVVLADEFAAFECRATLSADGTSATPIEPPSRLDPASTAPLGEAAIEVVAHTRVDDPTGSRKLLIGRVGPEAFAVGILFNDESEVVATKDNGWYLAWWPGTAEPGAIVSSDMRNVVQEDVPKSGEGDGGSRGACRMVGQPESQRHGRQQLTGQCPGPRAELREWRVAEGSGPRAGDLLVDRRDPRHILRSTPSRRAGLHRQRAVPGRIQPPRAARRSQIARWRRVPAAGRHRRAEVVPGGDALDDQPARRGAGAGPLSCQMLVTATLGEVDTHVLTARRPDQPLGRRELVVGG
jgi:hypothetical protein